MTVVTPYGPTVCLVSLANLHANGARWAVVRLHLQRRGQRLAETDWVLSVPRHTVSSRMARKENHHGCYDRQSTGNLAPHRPRCGRCSLQPWSYGRRGPGCPGSPRLGDPLGGGDEPAIAWTGDSLGDPCWPRPRPRGCGLASAASAVVGSSP